jgi:hypothetical protein
MLARFATIFGLLAADSSLSLDEDDCEETGSTVIETF